MLALILFLLLQVHSHAEVTTSEESELPKEVVGDRNLVQFGPMLSIFNGPHGSFHYNPEEGKRFMDASEAEDVHKLEDIYAHPRTACTLNKVFEEWRKNHCPDISTPGPGPGGYARIPYQKRPCRISFGDIAHRRYANWSDHETHDDGTCIDMRPFRDDEFKNEPMQHDWANYSQSTTVQFLRFIKKFGASDIFFNDPDILNKNKKAYVPGVSKVAKHDDHIHFCLKPDKIPAKYCPELKDEPMHKKKDELPDGKNRSIPIPTERPIRTKDRGPR